MPLLVKAVIVVVLFGVFFKAGVVAFCQILGFIVAINVLFNKKWHAAYQRRYELQSRINAKMPVWLRRTLIAVISVGAALHLMFRLHDHCKQEQEKRYCRHVPSEMLAKMFDE